MPVGGRVSLSVCLAHRVSNAKDVGLATKTQRRQELYGQSNVGSILLIEKTGNDFVFWWPGGDPVVLELSL